MPKVDDEAKAWKLALSERFGKAVLARRKALRMTGIQLWERTRELGYPITAVAISKIENNTREGKLDLVEVLVLSASLDASPLRLLFGGAPSSLNATEVLPGRWENGIDALRQFVGLDTRGDMHVAIRRVEVDQALSIQRRNLYQFTHGPEQLNMSKRMAEYTEEQRRHTEKQIEILEAEQADLWQEWVRSIEDA